MFKKLKLSAALSAALMAGTLSGQAQAVNLTQDGLGDAAIFQYYSARDNWQTFFRLINTSEDALAVKLRFHEADNSREVLDFTLFLSPNDEWTAWTDQNAAGAGMPGIMTYDTSCIYEGVDNNTIDNGFKTMGDGVIAAKFSPKAFSGLYHDSSAKSAAERLSEGYLEVIGVAQVDAENDATARSFISAVSHTDRDSYNRHVPNSCGEASSLFNLNAFQNSTTDVENVLAANAYLINVTNGQGAGYDPLMLANFADEDSDFVQNVLDTDTLPNLDSGSVVSVVMDNTGNKVISTLWSPESEVLWNGTAGTRPVVYSADLNGGGVSGNVPFDLNGDGICSAGESASEANLPAPNAASNSYYDIGGGACYTSQARGAVVSVAVSTPSSSSRVLQNGKLASSDITGGVDAVSALIMRKSVINEWGAAPSTAGTIKDYFTQWVLSFPTKHYYVDLQDDPFTVSDDYSPTLKDPRPTANDAFAPFSMEFDIAGKSCENFVMDMWDVEEDHSAFVSPEDHYTAPLCSEVNVVNFNDSYTNRGLASAFSVTVPQQVFPTAPNGDKSVMGWARLTFTGAGTGYTTGAGKADGLTSANGSVYTALDLNGAIPTSAVNRNTVDYKGLPVDGFMLSVYETGDSRNHTAITKHKYERDIDSGV